jgi:hypothetical protein
MKKTDVLILDRNDLIDREKETPIEKIEYYMFKQPYFRFTKAALIIFVDEDNILRVIKNRYGNKVFAPDMLEALQSVNNYFIDLQNKCALTFSDERAWKLVSKAIKKATE